MHYIEVKFTLEPFSPWSDLLSAELGEIGYESFVEEEPNTLLAYVEEEVFDEKALKNVDTLNTDLVSVSYDSKLVKQENWNAQWESNFEPVYVGDQICVRATFHEDEPNYPYQIVIDPKMSFGTGHHATTHLMLEGMLGLDFKDKTVIDMGSGTGVLAIFAAMKGARSVVAIDIDEWCSINAKENAARNNVDFIEIYQGDKELLVGKHADILLANINKNILLTQLPFYAGCLSTGGKLFMSGFYEEDVTDLKNAAIAYGFTFMSHKVMNKWTTMFLIKE